MLVFFRGSIAVSFVIHLFYYIIQFVYVLYIPLKLRYYNRIVISILYKLFTINIVHTYLCIYVCMKIRTINSISNSIGTRT